MEGRKTWKDMFEVFIYIYINYKCNRYLKNHVNNRLIIDLFKRITPLDSYTISSILNDFIPFLKTNSYYLLYTNLLFELPYTALDYITQIPDLVIPSESSLVDRLIEHYQNKLISSPKAKTKYQKLLRTVLKNINWNSMPMGSINKVLFEVFDDINTFLEESSKQNINRIYYTPPKIDNEVILNILIKYYSEEILRISIDQEDKLELMKNQNNIKPYLEMLLSTDDIRQILITLLLVIDLGQSLSSIIYIYIYKYSIYFLVNHQLHNRVFDHLVHQYNRCNENIKRVIPKCLIVLIRGESSLHALTEFLESSILDEILKFSEYISDDILQLIMFFKKQPLHILLNTNDPSSSDIFSQDQLSYSQSPLLQPSITNSPNMIVTENIDDDDEPQLLLNQISPLYSSSQSSSQKTPPKLPPDSPLNTNNRISTVNIPIKRENDRISPYDTRSKKKMKITTTPTTTNTINNKKKKRKTKSPSISDIESVPSIHSDEELLEMERASHCNEIDYNNNEKNNEKSRMTYFQYGKEFYSLFTHEHFKLSPEYDGSECKFSVNPSFPNYITFNQDTGEIEGECPYPSSKVDYIVKCSNKTNALTFKLAIEVKAVTFQFKEEYKTGELSFSQSNTIVKSLSTNKDEYNISHCYVDVEMKKGIYRIVYQSFTPKIVLFGATTTNTSTDPDLHDQDNSWTIDIYADGIILYGKNKCKIPNWKAVKNAIYEMIYDMDKKTISIKLPDGKEYKLFKNVAKPLYPFVGLFYKNSAVKLISVEHEI